ncbi:MAG TPA: NAD(P)/FAD-dependent oxidoreductase [Tepidiformaceae bacterium]
MAESLDAAVVGAGPNGLSAAITLARAGWCVRVYEANETAGGGSRSEQLTLPGLVHDVCSAIHPFGASSPFFRALPLEEHGLQWVHPEVPLAHPFDDGPPVLLHRSLAETARGLDRDAVAYARLLRPFVRDWEALSYGVLAPVLRLPRHPLLMARFGLASLPSAQRLASSRFETPRARAMFAGLAAHSTLPLDRPLTSSFGLVLAASAHAVGWPVARGGSQCIADALVAYLRSLGGEVVTGQRVRSLDDLPPARATLLDVTPAQLLRLAGDRLSGRYRKALMGYRYGSGVFKLDYALSGPVPWKSPELALAGTIHLGGTMEEIIESERLVGQGRHPDRPYVIVAQQSLFDRTRTRDGYEVLWAYCHVPHGSTEDMTARIEAQLERFAPGFRDVLVQRHVMGPAALEQHNENYIGGDIAGGSHEGLQLFFRPAIRLSPYSTPADGVYLCSSSTPPGAGVHGMCGYWAARKVLADAR